MDNKNVQEISLALSEIERSSLKVLSDGIEKTLEQISKESSLNIDSVRRAVEWLNQKNLIELNQSVEKKLFLTQNGKKCLSEGLPEKKLLQFLKKNKTVSFQNAMKESGLSSQEFSFALGKNKAKAFIMVLKNGNETVLELTDVAKEFAEKESVEEIVLKKIEQNEFGFSDGEKIALNELIKRNLIEEKNLIERTAKINDNGLNALNVLSFDSKRSYNVLDPVPKIFSGKKQPYLAFLDSIRRKLVELGFNEMESKLIELEFYNFDALFQPQNHPARTWSDTYRMKIPSIGKLPDSKIVKMVKEAHESGGKTKSTGWNYDWSESIAKKLMPCAHGTASSARQLVKGINIPGKYFAMARCYRPDIVDATHLNEFNQMEGFIVDESFNFRHLLGMLKSFAIEIAGAEKARFYPDYYPFTEPSVQLSAKHPDLGWIEFGGAGIFRPEITEPLGIKGKCLAWGLGIDRLAMFKLGIKDIRELFSQDLNWLRSQKTVMQ